MSEYKEVNFDGLVGPSHNYGGLSFGNRASMTHGSCASNPKAAALQGLEKMRSLAEMGYAQAVLPPLFRPNLELLKKLGFSGKVTEQITSCYRDAPDLFPSVWSASSMWTANAATVFPSQDTFDRRLRLVPANLASQFHRSLEVEYTRDNLRAIFSDTAIFDVSEPLPIHDVLGDEGAANHTRFFGANGDGLHFFVYGADGTEPEGALRFPARQTLSASKAVARIGSVTGEQVVFAKQSARAINAGVFHNDVIAVGYGDTLFCHECALEEHETTYSELREAFTRVSNSQLQIVEVPESQVSLEDAVRSYLFNSQLLDRPEGGKRLLVPIECREVESVATYLDELIADPSSPIKELLVFNLRQSMRNGGGPACLRLRVQMNEIEMQSISGRVLVDEALYHDLSGWVERYYRDELHLEDLATEEFYHSCEAAFAELSQILDLPEIKGGKLSYISSRADFHC